MEMTNSADEEYYDSYDNVEVHNLMLKDQHRINAYYKAIMGNKSFFKDKIALEVGTGTGILSIFCAKAGASKVYAVEAAKGIAEIAKETVKENNLENIITVFTGSVETVIIPEKVDVIISEFMGFYLLHEGMLDSVIYCRRYLKENGRFFPEIAILWAVPCALPNYFEYWHDVLGVKMNNFGKVYRKSLAGKAEICTIDSADFLSKPIEIFKCDLRTIDVTDLQNVTAKNIWTVFDENGNCGGICLYFDVIFPVFNNNREPVILSTSPNQPETHWKQSLILFNDEISADVGEAFSFTINLFKTNIERKYQIELTLNDPDEMEHPTPCDCTFAKCRVIKAFIEKNENNEESDTET